MEIKPIMSDKTIVGGICHKCGRERSLTAVGPDSNRPGFNRLLCWQCERAELPELKICPTCDSYLCVGRHAVRPT